MNTRLMDAVIRFCDVIGGPLLSKSLTYPGDYAAVVENVDGFVTRDGFFRFFGTAQNGLLPSVSEWNALDWKREYGDSLSDVWIFAEDIFGNQFGLIDEAGVWRVCCEGGARTRVSASIMEFLLTSVLLPEPSAFDVTLARAAQDAGVVAGLGEHLAFEMPLIVGGEYALSNVTVESVALHLGVLGQMTRRNTSLRDGTSISRFTD